ncbi:g9076 [Coccomyxa viridis]|uniref:G9076 protein n=1 Tax=Coccomyxa viridis TaxID=1274662 RepID=A0ABP1G4K7_9CHLO
MQRFLNLQLVFPLEDFLRGWFLGAPFESILRNNVEEFVAYAFYCRRWSELERKEADQVARFTTQCEKTWNVRFQQGNNPHINFMAHLWEPLKVCHKPVIVHLFSEVAGATNCVWMLALGFRKQCYEGTNYWTLPRQVCKMEKPGEPIVFLHGVGIGLGPYFFWVLDLIRTFSRHTIILVEYDNISLRLHSAKVLFDSTAHRLNDIIIRDGFSKACIVGHSFGTFVASRLCKLHPEVVKSLVLIDAVCLLTCWPGLLYNFIYRMPACSLDGKGCLDVLRFICARDLMIAEVFCRDFSWSALMLWPEDMPPNTVICMSGEDRLVPNSFILRHLRAVDSSAQVVEDKDASHGAFLLPQCYKWRRVILRGMAAVIRP